MESVDNGDRNLIFGDFDDFVLILMTMIVIRRFSNNIRGELMLNVMVL